jgi:hypothetical protein
VHRPVRFRCRFDHSLREPGPADPTAKEGLGVKASDEQRVDKLQVATTGAVPNRGGTTVAMAQTRGSTNAADASIQNDSGLPQGLAGHFGRGS